MKKLFFNQLYIKEGMKIKNEHIRNNREKKRKERKYKTKNKTISPLPDERGKILIDQVFVQK